MPDWDRYSFVTVSRRDMRSIAAALREAAELLPRLNTVAVLADDYAETGRDPDEQE